MAFSFSQSQLDELTALRDAGTYFTAYRKIAEWAAGGDGVDPASIIWFRGAADVNEGVGVFSDFIRTYTATQYNIRYGSSLSPSAVQNASNAIAQAVLADVLSHNTVPSIGAIAANDAEKSSESQFSGDEAIWSGNLLFLGFGYNNAFFNNLINDEPDNAYDLLTAIKAASPALGSMSSYVSAIPAMWSAATRDASVAELAALQLSLTGSAVGAAIIGANDFLSRVYGGSLPAAELVASNITLGTINGNDELLGTSDSDFMHGSGGNDTLLSSSGSDVMDGGDGIDTADFSSVNEALTFFLKTNDDATGHFVGGVMTSDPGFLDLLFPNTDALFNIERILGGSSDDTFYLKDLSDSVQLVNGGNHGDNGDTLSLFYTAFETNFDMALGSIKIGDRTIEAVGFERVDGSDYADFVVASDDLRYFDGRGGSDTISYSNKTSAIQVNLSTASVADGTAEGDTIKNVEAVFGTSLSDSFVSSGKKVEILAGGSGDDTFYVKAGSEYPTIIWGGAGADTINIDHTDAYAPVGILVVNVQHLSEANFGKFDLSVLGLGDDFDWSLIDAVVLNPDIQDRFYYDSNELMAVQTTIQFEGTYLQSDHSTTATYHLPAISHIGDYEGSSNAVGEYKVSFLDGTETVVQAAAGQVGFTGYEDVVDDDLRDSITNDGDYLRWFELGGPSKSSAGYVTPTNYGNLDFVESKGYFFDIGNIFVYGSGAPQSSAYTWTYDADNPNLIPDLDHIDRGFSSVDSVGTITAIDSIGNWFVLGGKFDGSSLYVDAQHRIDVDMFDFA